MGVVKNSLPDEPIKALDQIRPVKIPKPKSAKHKAGPNLGGAHFN